MVGGGENKREKRAYDYEWDTETYIRCLECNLAFWGKVNYRFCPCCDALRRMKNRGTKVCELCFERKPADKENFQPREGGFHKWCRECQKKRTVGRPPS